MNCNAYCTAASYRFKELRDYLESCGKTAVISDIIHFQKHDGDVFFFPYGVVVFWNVPLEEEKRIRDEIGRFELSPLREAVYDQYSYQDTSDAFSIVDDHIAFVEDDYLEKLAASYAIMQSLKLVVFEQNADRLSEKTEDIPQNLVKKGKITLSRKQIARLRGELFLERRAVNLNFELLGTPDFFWEYPEVETVYLALSKYLDVNARVEILNKKLQVLHEMFEVVDDEEKHRHSSFLEWIIILLILIDIVISMIEKAIEKYL